MKAALATIATILAFIFVPMFVGTLANHLPYVVDRGPSWFVGIAAIMTVAAAVGVFYFIYCLYSDLFERK